MHCKQYIIVNLSTDRRSLAMDGNWLTPSRQLWQATGLQNNSLQAFGEEQKQAIKGNLLPVDVGWLRKDCLSSLISIHYLPLPSTLLF